MLRSCIVVSSCLSCLRCWVVEEESWWNNYECICCLTWWTWWCYDVFYMMNFDDVSIWWILTMLRRFYTWLWWVVWDYVCWWIWWTMMSCFMIVLVEYYVISWCFKLVVNWWIVCLSLMFVKSHPFCWNCRLVAKCRFPGLADDVSGLLTCLGALIRNGMGNFIYVFYSLRI